jgi:hypothetical protein
MIVQVAKKLVSVISQSKIVILTKLKVPFWIIFNSLHSSRFNNVQIISGSKVSLFPIICPKIIVVVCIQYILSQNYCPGMYWIHTRFRLFFCPKIIVVVCIQYILSQNYCPGMYWIHTRFRFFFVPKLLSRYVFNTYCPKIIVLVCIEYTPDFDFFCRANLISSMCMDNTVSRYSIQTRSWKLLVVINYVVWLIVVFSLTLQCNSIQRDVNNPCIAKQFPLQCKVFHRDVDNVCTATQSTFQCKVLHRDVNNPCTAIQCADPMQGFTSRCK